MKIKTILLSLAVLLPNIAFADNHEICNNYSNTYRSVALMRDGGATKESAVHHIQKALVASIGMTKAQKKKSLQWTKAVVIDVYERKTNMNPSKISRVSKMSCLQSFKDGLASKMQKDEI